MRPLEGLRVALIEDDPIMGESLLQSLTLEGISVTWWRSGEEAIAALPVRSPDVVLCDIRLPGCSGADVFQEASAMPAAAPFLFMTAYGDIDQAVDLMRRGASDYLTKPFQLDDLLERLGRFAPGDGATGTLGASDEMIRIERTLTRIAQSDTPVLITGPLGVGKEVCARRLHELSRPNTPFVAVNCAAIPPDLLEAEIFGHGSSTVNGRPHEHVGYAERAAEGVLVLDAISGAPEGVQLKLLELLDNGSFCRLGEGEVRPLRARIIALARDDEAAGTFRDELYYRLSTFSVSLPPLRTRPLDIEWLATLYFEHFRDRGAADAQLRGISNLAMEAARLHEWPGNARELRNRVERACALGPGPWLLPGDLFPPKVGAGAVEIKALTNVRDAAERRAILGTLEDTGGHLQEAAALLGISRTTLWEKMRRHALR